MTRLLVSVRSLDEARLAAAAGVDLIDLKEPRHGPLGRVTPDVALEVSRDLAPDNPLSMALGELADWTPSDRHFCHQIPPGIVYAKIGLARCAGLPDWRSQWQRAIHSFPSHCQPVAVAYADWQTAAAPEPNAVLAEAAGNGCRALLIDTWRKDSGDVFAHLSVTRLGDLIRQAHDGGLLTVLAGSLSLTNVERALSLSPGYLAVRGAVCGGARDDDVCPAKVAEWRMRVVV
ncbi:MAG TPA: (5-formylfuran-3-yl)methyl phosphate synthase [Pirellulales bacterium]|nr:(5-formylfuran-3-yl)methyl phosphate synthase [Pirellulales bacterium]